MTATTKEREQLNREQQTFLQMLHHDSRGGGILRLRLVDGSVTDVYASKDISTVSYTGTAADVYVSVNSMKMSNGWYTNRKASNVYSVNAFYIDLDLPEHKRTVDSDRIIKKNLQVITNAIANKKLPPYTMCTSTGNGLGLFFVLKRSIANLPSSAAQIRFYDYIYECLAKRIEEILKECQTDAMVVDKSVVGDHARVCRLPGTVNGKTNTYCTLEDVNESAMYTLSEFAQVLGLQKKAASKREDVKPVMTYQTSGERLSGDVYYAGLAERLEKLREERSSWRGSREVFCFIYYNAVKQCVNHSEAVAALYQFNDDLGERISQARLQSIIKTVDNNVARDGSYRGYYKLSNEWICTKLGLTEEEAAKYRLNTSSSWQTRNFENHMKTIKQRLAKHRMVVEAILSCDTYYEVVKMTGIPLSTVKQIAKQYNCSIKRTGILDATEIDWNGMYEAEADIYTEKSLKFCTSVVNQDNRSNEKINMDASELLDGFIPVTDEEIPFEEIPFEDASLEDIPFEAENTTSFEETEEISAFDKLPIHIAYADSFLDYLCSYCNGRYKQVIDLFTSYYRTRIKELMASKEYELAYTYCTILCHIATSYEHQVLLEYSCYDIDSLYQFIGTGNGNVRNCKYKVSHQDLLAFNAPNRSFVYNPIVPKYKTPEPVIKDSSYELDQTDYHYLGLADLMESDSYLHMLSVFKAVIADLESNVAANKSLESDICMLRTVRQNIPTFGMTRIENVCKLFDSYDESVSSTQIIDDLCKTLHCNRDRLSALKGTYHKPRTEAQKQAGRCYREHLAVRHFCSCHPNDVNCQMFLSLYRFCKKHQDVTFVLSNRSFTPEELRKQILYKLRVSDLALLNGTSQAAFIQSLAQFVS